MRPTEGIDGDKKGLPCPYCGAGRTVKNGRNRGDQWHKCRLCNRQHRLEGSLHGRRFPPEIIAKALQLFYVGRTYRQTARDLEERFDIDYTAISMETVYQWVKFYTEVAFRSMTARRAETGGHWVIEQVWNPSVACGVWILSDGGYVLAALFCRDSGHEHVTPLIRKAVEASVSHDIKVWTFRTTLPMATMKSFPRKVDAAIRRELPVARCIEVEGTAVLPSPGSSARSFGQFQPWVWDRFRSVRSQEAAQRFLNGLTVAHNVFQDPGAIDSPAPCRLVGVSVPFANWLDVVKMGASRPR